MKNKTEKPEGANGLFKKPAPPGGILRKIAPPGSKLAHWQQKLAANKQNYDDTLSLMGQRDAIYNGTDLVDGPGGAPAEKRAGSVYNAAYELIESQVDSTIPMPRVTARRSEDTALAAQIEDMLRAKTDQLPFEELNDIDERNTYNQGGSFMLVEWDSAAATHTTLGDLAVSIVHPRQVIPQDGVAAMEEMDYFFVRAAVTRDYIKRRYGKEVQDTGEEDTELRGPGAETAADLVTLNTAYYRTAEGIGRYVWANDTELADVEDYQARKLERCKKCGAQRQPGAEECPGCGGKKFAPVNEDYETLAAPAVQSDGTEIPVESPVIGEDGLPVLRPVQNPDGSIQLDEAGLPVLLPLTEPTRIPYYKPGRFPLLLRKNVSKFGALLGSSDIDIIRPQQNAIKKLTSNVMEKLLKGGSYVTLPVGVRVETNDKQLKILRIDNPAQKALIDVLNIQPNISFDMSVLNDQYEKARSALGITSSFQGKPDYTANSGAAKRFAAAQSAGRLESKRRMKNAFYQRLYETMFRFMLAYADQPVHFRARNQYGEEIYTTFNRYDFLKRDAAGKYYWDDEFLFSVDTTGGLAQNREAMWSEAERKFTTGAMGEPADPATKMLYWTLLEQLQFPMAKAVKQTLLEQQKKREEEAAAAKEAAAEAAQAQPAPASGAPQAAGGTEGLEMQAAEIEQLLAQMGGEGNALPGM